MELPQSVEIVEVGPRDGLQSVEKNVPTTEKIYLLEALAAAGIKRFEATSFASPKSIPQLADAEEMLAGLPREQGVDYGADPERAGIRAGESGGGRGGRTRGLYDRRLLPG